MCLLIILFLYTGVNKIIDHEQFQSTLANSPLLENSFLIMSYFVPIVEILLTFGLLVSLIQERPILRKWSLFVSTLLMAAFTIYVGYMLKFSPKLPCSCGGIIQKMSWRQHLYFNILFTLMAATSLYLNQKKYQLKTAPANI